MSIAGNMTTNVVVYIACKMSGRDKLEMHKRASFVCDVFKQYGITPISPVIEEQVKPEEGKLINHDKERLRVFWQRDKEIIRSEAHVVFLDHAEMKSIGMEREYAFSRYCLWRPTVLFLPEGSVLSVAQFEDDAIVHSVEEAAKLIRDKWGTRRKRIVWRIRLLLTHLPRFVIDQLKGWR